MFGGASEIQRRFARGAGEPFPSGVCRLGASAPRPPAPPAGRFPGSASSLSLELPIWGSGLKSGAVRRASPKAEIAMEEATSLGFSSWGPRSLRCHQSYMCSLISSNSSSFNFPSVSVNRSLYVGHFPSLFICFVGLLLLETTALGFFVLMNLYVSPSCFEE